VEEDEEGAELPINVVANEDGCAAHGDSTGRLVAGDALCTTPWW